MMSFDCFEQYFWCTMLREKMKCLLRSSMNSSSSEVTRRRPRVSGMAGRIDPGKSAHRVSSSQSRSLKRRWTTNEPSVQWGPCGPTHSLRILNIHQRKCLIWETCHHLNFWCTHANVTKDPKPSPRNEASPTSTVIGDAISRDFLLIPNLTRSVPW